MTIAPRDDERRLPETMDEGQAYEKAVETAEKADGLFETVQNSKSSSLLKKPAGLLLGASESRLWLMSCVNLGGDVPGDGCLRTRRKQ